MNDSQIFASTSLSRNFRRFRALESPAVAYEVNVTAGPCCASIVTAKGRRTIARLILAVALIPVLAMTVQNAFITTNSNNSARKAWQLRDYIVASVDIGALVHVIQLERGVSALYLSSQGDVSIKASLVAQRYELDLEIQKSAQWLWEEDSFQDLTILGDKFLTKDTLMSSLVSFRDAVDMRNVTVTATLMFYSQLNEQLLALMVSWMLKSFSVSLGSQLVAYNMLIVSKEQAGMERALGSSFYLQGK